MQKILIYFLLIAASFSSQAQTEAGNWVVIERPQKKVYERAVRLNLNFYFNGGWGQNKYTYGRSFAMVYGSIGMEFKNVFYLNAVIGFGNMDIKRELGPKYTSIIGASFYTYYLSQFFIEIKSTPLRKAISPLGYVNCGGGSVIFSSGLGGGTLFKAGMGIRFKTGDYSAIELSYNYNYQELSYEGNGDRYNYSTDKGTLFMAYSGIQLGIVRRF